MDRLSGIDEHSSCSQDFTMNLISNASMETFPENTLSSFTTLLPSPFHLSGEWQVALLEIAWPNSVQNVTVGEFTLHKRNIQPPVEKRPRKHNRPGTISMAIPAAFDRQSPSTLPLYAAPVKHRLKPGCYTSVDSILASITKIAMGEKQNGRKRNPSSPDNISSLLSWKVDNVTRKLQVKFYGNHKQHGLRIFTESNDLRNILGTNVIIDCGDSPREAEEGIVDSESASNIIVKHVGKWPVDLNSGSHTMFLYCDLVQNQTLGDKQTALLRSIPVKSLALAQTLGEMNHKSFTNLQWKRVKKPQFQSINVTLANEMGQKVPFLRCGRTNVTLAFRPTPRH